MIICIQWQIRGVLKRLYNDLLDSLTCALIIILIALFWVMNTHFSSVVSP